MLKTRPGAHCLTSQQVQEVRDRLDRGWSQADLSKLYGVSRQTITNIKLGAGRFSVGARPVALQVSRIGHVGTIKRFRAAVTGGAPDECWVYTGTRLPTGYGIVWSTADSKRVYAHRFALELSDGRLGPEDMHACHRCDNPRCCNPQHLFWGTPGDNIRDMIGKGRARTNTAGLLRHNRSAEHRRAVSERIRAYNASRVARHPFRGGMHTVAEIAETLNLDRSAIKWRLRVWGQAEKA